MDERRHNINTPGDSSAYGTGSTEPPKNNGGLIALLLILVICLSGAVSALGLINNHLFQELRQIQPETAPLSFADESLEQPAPQYAGTVPPIRKDLPLGISGEEVSPFYQRYYHFPRGLYITDVAPGSPAESLGLQPGDILTSLDGIPVTGPASFESVLRDYRSGERIELLIFRGGRQLSLQLTLE